MCRYPSSSAHRTALTHSAPLGTCQTPRPSIGSWLPSASTRARPSSVTGLVAMTVSLVRRGFVAAVGSSARNANRRWSAGGQPSDGLHGPLEELVEAVLVLLEA